MRRQSQERKPVKREFSESLLNLPEAPALLEGLAKGILGIDDNDRQGLGADARFRLLHVLLQLYELLLTRS